ncbi:CRISPR-associated endonuclease Cas1 [Kallotenue papyrolyticum]|uniref:CRISPR-associated endonuclease Cas1 n=1 Tax=Kallotenue papyrolyticum TaxID=1325125 RepID=UPI000492BE47|nr:CRISPR-associated endonuclease Cas1 [Kallotenue papyrolyticum]
MPPLYLLEQGAELRCDGECLLIHQDGQPQRSVPLIKVEQVVVFGNVRLSTPAIKRLLDREIDVIFLTVDGRFQGRLVGATPPHVGLRRRQYRRAEDRAWALELARALVLGKLHNGRTLLQRYRRDRQMPPPELDEAIAALAQARARAMETQGHAALLGAEGFGTQRYFAGLRALFDPAWGFTTRARRPPTDPVNVLLSLGYTLLLHNVVSALETVGLDPYLGFLHREVYNRPALALDLMEEFRPVLVDSVVVQVCRDGTLTPALFSRSDDAERPVVLEDAGKRRFIEAFEARLRREVLHPEGSDSAPGQVSYRRCIELQARRLARAIQQGSVYQPFQLR